MRSGSVRTAVNRCGVWGMARVGLLAGGVMLASAQAAVLQEWSFKQDGNTLGWTEKVSDVTDLAATGGALHGRITGKDPWVTSPRFAIPAKLFQRVEFRMRANLGGLGQVYWTHTTESQYGGFEPGKATSITFVGDGEWHEYSIMPVWHKEGEIILLRLDFPSLPDGDATVRTFDLEWLRITDGDVVVQEGKTDWTFMAGPDGWTPVDKAQLAQGPDGLTVRDGAMRSPPLKFAAAEYAWFSCDVTCGKGACGVIEWVSSESAKLCSRSFYLRGDGGASTCTLDMSSEEGWAGDILMLQFAPDTGPSAAGTVRRLGFAHEAPKTVELEVLYAGFQEGVNRAGGTHPFIIQFRNWGGQPAAGLRIKDLSVPEGLRLPDGDAWRSVSLIRESEYGVHTLMLPSTAPVKGDVVVTLEGPGAPVEPIRAAVEVTPALGLPKADYVPVPKPVPCDYEIGAYYFPGWSSYSRWHPVQRVGPVRKPVLGWYDEANPECVDWQIKWAVENGIKFFMVDWYWNRGGRHLEHWVQSFGKARYRSYLKWCVMWANHNPKKSHDEADQRAVTQYWLDNCFNMPEYYRINDQPVVIMWSPSLMRTDMAGQGGAQRLLDISRDMAKAAGYKGIYFIAMKFPEHSTEPSLITQLKDEGYDMTAIYHYMDPGEKARGRKWVPFEQVVESSLPFMEALKKTDILPFLPNMSTGWDSRPWHGDKSTVIYGRTTPLFRKICEDTKKFADANGVRILSLGPLNEWGEGSYLEPCTEFGFSMYEAVRDVFCRKPAEGWPVNVGPTDVGRGPYDLPLPWNLAATAWDFRDKQQWWQASGAKEEPALTPEGMAFTTAGKDPVTSWACIEPLAATEWPFMVVRMKAESPEPGKDGGQLFWGTSAAPRHSEPASVRFDLICDGAFHDYVLDLKANRLWKGRVQSLRFDPSSRRDVRLTLESLRLSRDGK